MNENLQKKTLHFRVGDWDFIESVSRPNGIPTSLVIRNIISQWVDARREPNTKPDVEYKL
jgi:hypothetical protein